jgi:hypothetical protein
MEDFNRIDDIMGAATPWTQVPRRIRQVQDAAELYFKADRAVPP